MGDPAMSQVADRIHDIANYSSCGGSAQRHEGWMRNCNRELHADVQNSMVINARHARAGRWRCAPRSRAGW